MNNQTARRIWLTKEQRKLAVVRYEKGESPQEIADTFGVCANNVRNTLIRAGVPLRDRSLGRRVYRHREDVFDTITPTSAYWIGFLFADGSTYAPKVGSPRLTVGLQARDREHLEKLRAFLEAEHPLYRTKNTIRGKTHAGIQLALASPRLVSALHTRGMCRKSLDRVASAELSTSRDFWRGVVDGDGYLYTSKIRRESGNLVTATGLGLCGGLVLMEQFLEFLHEHDIAADTRITAQGKIYRVRMGGETAARAAGVLYQNAKVALTRKLLRANLILDLQSSSPSEVKARGT